MTTSSSLNVYLGFSHTFPRTLKVVDVAFAILGCDFLSFHGFQVDVKNKRLIESERSVFDSIDYHQFSSKEPMCVATDSAHTCVSARSFIFCY